MTGAKHAHCSFSTEKIGNPRYINGTKTHTNKYG